MALWFQMFLHLLWNALIFKTFIKKNKNRRKLKTATEHQLQNNCAEVQVSSQWDYQYLNLDQSEARGERISVLAIPKDGGCIYSSLEVQYLTYEQGTLKCSPEDKFCLTTNKQTLQNCSIRSNARKNVWNNFRPASLSIFYEPKGLTGNYLWWYCPS